MSKRRPKGCIYQRPDSSVWWIKYSLNGKSFRESTHSENRRKAVKLLDRRLGEIGTGAFGVFERYNIITQADIKDAMIKLQTSEKALKQQQEEQRKEGEPNFGHVFGHVGPAKNPSAVN